MYDIFFAIHDTDSIRTHIKSRFPLAKFCVINDDTSIQDALFEAQKRSMTKMFWFVNLDQEIVDNFNFDYEVPVWDQKYAHVFKDSNVFLIPRSYGITEKEASYMFFVNKKEVDLKIANTRPTDIFFAIYDVEEIKLRLHDKFPTAKFCYLREGSNIRELLYEAQASSLTKMFWFVNFGYDLTENFNLDYDVPEWDQRYVHTFKEETTDTFAGTYLIPKSYPITKKEADHLFFVNKKEISTVVSRKTQNDIFFVIYDVEETKQEILSRYPTAKFCYIDQGRTIQDTLYEAQRRSSTEMFWFVDFNHELTANFDLNFDIPKWDQQYVHTFQDSGAFLVPKFYPITKKEADRLFFVNKKEISTVVSRKTQNDIFFAIYDVEEERNEILSRYPTAKFCYIDQGKTIQDTLYEAQRRASTEMFWFVDFNHELTADFDLNFDIPKWDQQYVHVFQDSSAFLIPKSYPITKKEADHLFFVNKKEIDTKLTSKKQNDIFFAIYDVEEIKQEKLSRYPTAKFCYIDQGKTIQDTLYEAQRRSSTEMFWFVDFGFEFNDKFDINYEIPNWDQQYVHVFQDSSAFLIPKFYPITKKEADHLFFVNKKEIDTRITNKTQNDIFFVIYDVEEERNEILSRYPTAKFCYIDQGKTIQDTLYEAQRRSSTEMFWFVHVDYYVTDDFNFKLEIPKWDQEYVHVFKDNMGNYGGVFLLPKFYPITKKEADHLFFVNKKEIDAYIV